jgi:gliding motility-associated-like protein
MHPTHIYTLPGTYEVMLISKNGLGCQDTTFQTIRIHPIPEPNFISNITAGCAPLTVYFDNSTKLPQGFNDSIYYTWRFGDGTSAYDKYAVHTYRRPGTYSVRLTAQTQFACEDSILYSNLITVYPVPNPAFIYQPVEFGVYDFTEVTTGGTPPYSFYWDFGDGTSSTQQNPRHEFVIDKIGFEFGFNVCLTVTDVNGCDSTLCDTVKIGAFTLFVPNAMSPDSDGEEKYFLPKGSGLESYNLQIFDRWGNKLWETDKLDADTASPVEGWDGTYNGELVPAGVYVWRIDATFANGIVWRGQSLNGENSGNSGTITILR